MTHLVVHELHHELHQGGRHLRAIRPLLRRSHEHAEVGRVQGLRGQTERQGNETKRNERGSKRTTTTTNGNDNAGLKIHLRVIGRRPCQSHCRESSSFVSSALLTHDITLASVCLFTCFQLSAGTGRNTDALHHRTQTTNADGVRT